MLQEISVDSFRNNSISSSSADRLRSTFRIPFAKARMKVTTFLNKVSDLPEIESLKKLTPEEQEIYLKLKAKVQKTNPLELEYSKLFASKVIKGNIALSIDPIDYLLMSTNKCGWNSCYTLSHGGRARDFGAYVAGIFSYICDPSTIIAFRYNDTKVKYEIGSATFEEYSKNWRQVIYLNTENYSFATSRQYPGDNNELAKSIRAFLEDTISDYLKVENTWKFKTITNLELLREMIDEVGTDYLGYNDIFARERGGFAYNTNLLSDYSFINIKVNSEPICPRCGENHLDDSNLPICQDCWYEIGGEE